MIVDGCKRFVLARQSEAQFVDCLEITPAPDTGHAALLRMSLNALRPLHFFEKILFVNWLGEHCDKARYNELAARLPMDSRERYEIEQLAACDAPVIDAVYNNIIERNLAAEAQRLSPPDRAAVFAFAHRYRFSRQMQRELLDWLPELAFREKCTIADILLLPEIVEIEKNTRLNAPQKIERLRTALFNRRFPTLARAKKVWDELAARCNPDSRLVQFKPAEAFEKNRLELKITVSNAEEAKTVFNRLATIDSTDLNRLIYPAQFYG